MEPVPNTAIKQQNQVVIGIDVGGSTTKIVGFRPDATRPSAAPSMIDPIIVKATDPITSIYGAFGRFTTENNLSIKDIGKVMMTGVGSSYLKGPIYDLPCHKVPEFSGVGIGGLYLSGLDNAIVVSMGTGTALVHAVRHPDGRIETEYLGGTGVGGGTLTGLARRLVGVDSVRHLETLCDGGDLSKIDLTIRDITREDEYPMNGDLTAANFGKLSDLADNHDIALGLTNMVAEIIAMLSIFAARGHGIGDIVLTGNLTAIKPIRRVFENLQEPFKVRFLFPELSQYGTVIGAALYNQSES